MLLFYKMLQIDLFLPASLAHLKGKEDSESIKPEGILSNFYFLFTIINAQSVFKIVMETWSLSTLSI